MHWLCARGHGSLCPSRRSSEPGGDRRLFIEEGRIEILYDKDGGETLLEALEGREAIADAVRHMMAPHAPRTWSPQAASAG